MDNVGTMNTLGMLQYLLFLAVVVAAFLFAREFLRSRMQKNGAKIFSKEIEYEIWYRNELVKKGSLWMKNKEVKRFGFSAKSEYGNHVILEKFLADIEDLDEDDVREMQKHYNTWFKIKLVDGEFKVLPAYTAKEQYQYKGNKPIYLEQKTLKPEGEIFDVDMHIFGSRDRENSFRVDLFDPSAEI